MTGMIMNLRGRPQLLLGDARIQSLPRYWLLRTAELAWILWGPRKALLGGAIGAN